MHRDDMRDDPREQYRTASDPRDAPIERYGNEEDQYSREYRRVYAEEDLPRRLRDDRPYNRPGYEPEAGRPGGRENVDLHRGRGQGDHPTYGNDWGQRDPEATGGRGQYQGQRQYRGQGQPGSQRRHSGERDPYGQSAYRQLASPYADDDAIESWYGGDTGMGDPGTSQRGRQGEARQTRWSDSRGQSGGYGQGDRYSSRQASSFTEGQYGRNPSGQQFQAAGGRQDWQQAQGDPQHGPFTGRGPRNYQRSDDRIRDDVCELLTRHGAIDASQMDVEVRHGVVTLRGTADSGRVRRMAEELVEDLAGVRDVQNELRVNRGHGMGMGDTSALVGHPSSSGEYRQEGTGQQASVPAYGTGVASTSGVSTRTGPGEPGLSGGGGRSQHGNPWQVRETMDVVGSDGESVGTVKTVAGADFILDRPMARDLHVPFSAVQTVDGERVLLRCRAAEVDRQNWPTSDMTGTGSSGSTGERPASR